MNSPTMDLIGSAGTIPVLMFIDTHPGRKKTEIIRAEGGGCEKIRATRINQLEAAGLVSFNTIGRAQYVHMTGTGALICSCLKRMERIIKMDMEKKRRDNGEE